MPQILCVFFDAPKGATCHLEFHIIPSVVFAVAAYQKRGSKVSQPPTVRLSWNMYTLHKHFCKFGTDLHAQSVLIYKITASESSVESLLRVRC